MADVMLTFKTPTRVQDENGVWKTAGVTEREVFAQKASVTRSEFFAGGQKGLDPELVFKVFHAEYQGEEECIYNGEAYVIYRTFHPDGSDYMEIYVERKVGVHGG